MHPSPPAGYGRASSVTHCGVPLGMRSSPSRRSGHDRRRHARPCRPIHESSRPDRDSVAWSQWCSGERRMRCSSTRSHNCRANHIPRPRVVERPERRRLARGSRSPAPVSLTHTIVCGPAQTRTMPDPPPCSIALVATASTARTNCSTSGTVTSSRWHRGHQGAQGDQRIHSVKPALQGQRGSSDRGVLSHSALNTIGSR